MLAIFLLIPFLLIRFPLLSHYSKNALSRAAYFAPDRPKTNPKIKNAEQYESRLDVEGLVERAVAGIMITEIRPQAETDEVDELIEDLL